jgi:hypothetical protein
MTNFFVSYDLNGSTPTHAQMDKHLKAVAGVYGRVLETVWYLTYRGSASQLRVYLERVLSLNDRVLVMQVDALSWRNLLISDASLKRSLDANW